LTTRNADTPRQPVSMGLTSLIIGVLLSSALIFNWHSKNPDYMILKSSKLDSNASGIILAKSEGILETVVIRDQIGEGLGKILITNGHNMSGTGFLAQRYMRAFAHIPLLQLDAFSPSSALVICFGVGNTLHATTLHSSLKRIDMVDISENVLNHNEYFADTNFGALKDPRVDVYINDGRQHLRMQPDETYDLVTLEPPPIVFAGVSGLYSREFYEVARSKLKPGGFMTTWLPFQHTSNEMNLAIVKAFVDVFPNAVLLAGAYSDIILIGRNSDENTIDHRQFLEALKNNPRIEADLKRFDMSTLTEVMGSFLAAPSTMTDGLADVSSVTDDYPIMEYAPIYTSPGDPPSEILNVWDIGEWCTSCIQDGQYAEDLNNLEVYLQIMDKAFETKFRDAKTSPDTTVQMEFNQEDLQRAIRETPYLLHTIGGQKRQ
ncbi:MAG: hypothetical protein OEU86_06745, partial [Gammaproteobacteria bacterium]|nr:hypothetical protein [Gammaproteobacteria bacterium]